MRLHQKNKFTQASNGVWLNESMTKPFAYSDGSEVEQRLGEILKSADDLSSNSYELMNHITDWPTEYHLTGKRANLLKPLDFSNIKRVLELGCGCGSITRYLGEQGIEVDAVEGSPIRAELAKLRTQDQSHVQISTANFNDIEFDENYYDLVLFVGVTEYAGRFSDLDTDEAALQALLTRAKLAIKNSGTVLVAIENRTGLKYLMGACEDHYGKPFIGIHNYPESEGIRTYTKHEWHQHIQEAGFIESQFLYPFPDYKIPTALFSDNYLNADPYAYRHLEELRSRDYLRPYVHGSREVLNWEAYAANQQIGDYANSFLILMGNEAKSLNGLVPLDFAHLPSYSKKRIYSVDVVKHADSDDVCVYKTGEAFNEAHLLDRSSFISGLQLSAWWARLIGSELNDEKWLKSVKNYVKYIETLDSKDVLSAILPNQIFVTSTNCHDVNQWQLAYVNSEIKLPEAYQSDQSALVDLALFRALCFLWNTYKEIIQDAYSPRVPNWQITDWFKHAFDAVGREISNEKLNLYQQLNDAHRNNIFVKPSTLDLMSPMFSMDISDQQAQASSVIDGSSSQNLMPRSSILRSSILRRVLRRIKRACS